MKNKRRITGILAAVILATIGTVALVGYVQSAKDEALAEERMVDVYVVDQLVPKGATAETINASVSVEQIPARLQQPGAITDLDEVGVKVAATDLQPGDQLLAARLVGKEQVSEEVTDKVQISAMFTPVQAVGGTIEKGDLVGVYLSFDEKKYEEAAHVFDGAVSTAGFTEAASTATDAETESTATPEATEATSTEVGWDTTPEMTRLEFQHVLVTNVQTTTAPVTPDETDEEGPEQISADQYVITLALSPEQSERFVFATEFGRLWLSNEPATVSDDGTRLVTLGNVYSVAK
jgi:pilus assembly protein CpaB